MAEKKKRPNALVAFFQETRGELGKVSWPSRREVIQLTTIVLVVMVIMGIVLGITDLGARSLLDVMLGLG